MTSAEPGFPTQAPTAPPPLTTQVYGEQGEILGWTDTETGEFVQVDTLAEAGVQSEV